MKLSSVQNKNLVDTPREIILYHLQSVKISEKSFANFGDKNKITKGVRALYLSKNGQSLDKFVNDALGDDLAGLDEKQKIEKTIEVMVQFDSKAKINDYFKKTIKPITKTKPVIVSIKDAKPCLVKASLQHMSRKVLKEELENLIKNPKSYFGPLLEVDECKVDLFTVSDKQQIVLAKQMLAQIEKEEKPKVSLGEQKNISLGYGEVLQAQKGYSNLNTQSKSNNIPMKKTPTTKTAPKGAKATKSSTGVSLKQKRNRERISKISDKATEIQKAGGKKTIPAKSVFVINRADAVKKAAKQLKK